MKIKVGDLDVLESGTIVGTEGQPIDFIFNETTGFMFRIVFETDYEIYSHRRRTEKLGRIGAKIIVAVKVPLQKGVNVSNAI